MVEGKPPPLPAWAGNHPFPPNKKKPVHITRERQIDSIYGTGTHRINTCIYASTDKILMSHFRVPPGGSFMPPDIHAGDELYYVLEGNPTLVNPETGQALNMKEGDAALIPERAWHLVYNFGDKDVVIIAMIEGPLWDESMGRVDMFKLKYKYLKGEG
jgi:gentisate 1,2-dioxygenase